MRRCTRRRNVASLYPLKSWPTRSNSISQILSRNVSACTSGEGTGTPDFVPILDPHNEARHVLHGHDQVYRASGDGAVRHAAMLRRRPIRALSKRKAAASPDCLQAQRTVVPGAGQDDANSILA